MSDLLQQVESAITREKLLARGQSLLVAVSGGVDSMVLLHVLHELAAKHRWKLVVAHFNHCLRGRASDGDEKFVRAAAARLKLKCVAGRGDVRQFAQKKKLSVEMAARELRHRFLAGAARRLKLQIIATAHHADDQVELFFLRLLRGAGSAGLGGMSTSAPSPAEAKVRLIRPLLEIAKAELVVFATARRIKFREDASNTSLDFQRNRVRHELLPLLRRNYQPALDKTVRRVMDIVREEGRCVRTVAEQWLKRNQAGGFSRLPVAVQRQVLQLQLRARGVEPDFEMIERLRRSADGGFPLTPALVPGESPPEPPRLAIQAPEPERTGGGSGTGVPPVQWDAALFVGLPESSSAPLDRQDACPTTRFMGRENPTPPVGETGRGRFTKRDQWRLPLPGERAGVRGIAARLTSRGSTVASGLLWLDFTGPGGATRLGDAKFRWEIAPFNGASGRLPRFSSRQEFFDADKIGARVCLRHWRPGDRFQPIGMSQPVKLQDLFTNLKVPRAARHRRWLAATERGVIFWVEGLRMGEQFKLDKTTRGWLKWQWRRGVRSK